MTETDPLLAAMWAQVLPSFVATDTYKSMNKEINSSQLYARTYLQVETHIEL